MDTNESKTSESKTVTFSTDYSLGPQISYIPDTINTVTSLTQQISHDPGTISATQGSNPPISHVSDSFSYTTQPGLFGDVHTEPLAASTPANTKELSTWFPLLDDGSNESYLSEGPLESACSSFSLEPLRLHTPPLSQSCMLQRNTSQARRVDNGFSSSLLLPGSLSAQQAPDSMYHQTIEHTAIPNTALLTQTQPTQDSCIYMGTSISAPYSEGSFNLIAEESPNNLLQISNQLHQQLNYVHTELQKIASLQQQQQMLTQKQLLILPREQYGSYTDLSHSAQIPTTETVTNKALVSNKLTQNAQLHSIRPFSPSLQRHNTDAKIKEPQMQHPFNQTTATYSQVQSLETPRLPTFMQSFSTQTQNYMQPCSTQTTLPFTQSYGTQTSEHGQLPSMSVPFDTSTRQTSFAQAMHNNVGSNKLVGTQMGTITNNAKTKPYLWPAGECTSCYAYMDCANSCQSISNNNHSNRSSTSHGIYTTK